MCLRSEIDLFAKTKIKFSKGVKFVGDFEKTASELAIKQGYHFVVCGHIHEPKMIHKANKNGTTLYLNSGDWVENLTALEYNKKRWKLYRYDKNTQLIEEDFLEMEDKLCEQLVASLIFNSKEFHLKHTFFILAL